MHTPTRTLTPARIVALALIAVLVSGLAYLGLAPEPGPMSVPAGAEAGDLVLEPCEFTTEDGSYAADCGALVVPENRADPSSRLIALPVTRVRAQSDHPAEPILYLEGGPGHTNMAFERASRFIGDRDFVMVGYRGVDGSVRLDCPEVVSALKRSTDVLGEESFRAYGDGLRACADRLTDEGVDVTQYGLVQQVDDMEAARVALGYDQIELLSESAGTRTAMIYSWRHPESIHRSVMVAVNPPGHFLWDAETTDEQIDRYAELCSRDGSCSQRTDDLAASIRRTNADLPDRWFVLPIDPSGTRVISFMALMESTAAAAPASGPMTLDAWLSAAEGDQSGLWFESLAADVLLPEMFVWGQYAAAGSIDAQTARDRFSSAQLGGSPNLGDAITAFVWGGGQLGDAWPTAAESDTYDSVQTSQVETLLVGGELDFSTPPQVAAEELLPYLPNGHQVVLSELAHTTDFWTHQPQASSRLITTFYDSGEVDDSRYEPTSVDFTPEATHTGLAKRIAGLLVGLALVAVASLLVMAHRVHRRGGFGHVASVTLRSLSPVVLGLGGWSLGALVVLTTMPGLPLDDELLAGLAVGLPVGLGTYLAWVQRRWPTQVRRIGLAAAVGSSLVGAWLGFHATKGMFAVATAIAGAVAGANLALILFDMSRVRPAGEPLDTEAAVVPASSPQPATTGAERR